MDFKEYRQKAYEYMKNKCIIDNNTKILEEQGYIIKNYGESSGTLKIHKSMNTQEMKEIEDEFNVHFSLGGRKFVEFNFNEDSNSAKNNLMNEIRIAQKRQSDLYNGYFKDVVQSVYHTTKICDKHHRIELGRKFWGFMISDIHKLTLDEIIAIEKETDSTFINYNVTTGYQFNFNEQFN